MKSRFGLGLPSMRMSTGFGLVFCLAFGVTFGLAFGFLRSATGQELRAESPAPPVQDYACRVFPWNTTDGQGGYFESADRTGPVGAWLGPLTDSGWGVDHFDYEVGQKATGFPEPSVMVCVRRQRANAS
jgi:hypothetical protein